MSEVYENTTKQQQHTQFKQRTCITDNTEKQPPVPKDLKTIKSVIDTVKNWNGQVLDMDPDGGVFATYVLSEDELRDDKPLDILTGFGVLDGGNRSSGESEKGGEQGHRWNWNPRPQPHPFSKLVFLL